MNVIEADVRLHARERKVRPFQVHRQLLLRCCTTLLPELFLQLATCQVTLWQGSRGGPLFDLVQAMPHKLFMNCILEKWICDGCHIPILVKSDGDTYTEFKIYVLNGRSERPEYRNYKGT